MGDTLVNTPVHELKPGMSVYDYNYGMRRIRAITDQTHRFHIQFDDHGFDGWYLRRETLPLEVMS